MNTKLKLKGRISNYLLFPGILAILVVVAGGFISIKDRVYGLSIIIAGVVFIVIVIIAFFVNKPVIMKELVEFATDYAQIQKELLYDLALPYGLCDLEGNILWSNNGLKEVISEYSEKGKKVWDIFPEIKTDFFIFDDEEASKVIKVKLHDKRYSIELKRIVVNNIFNSTKVLSIDSSGDYIVAFYLFDETEITNLKKENENQKMVAGLIYIDNYEEAMESVEDVKRSLLAALIERKINQFVASVDGIVKKIEKDKYFIAFTYKYLEVMQSSKFSIIDEVKNVNIGNDMAVTISIGLGVHGDGYIQNCEYSRVAMDLALGRGGDQAVVKDSDKIYYYGGKSKQVEKNTRVKARVKAHALRELVSSKDKVLIMGHQIGDIDSFGAALGIYRAMKSLGKKANIILNDVTTSLQPVVSRVKQSDDYEPDMIISSAEALDVLDGSTVVVVVDVNRAVRTECPELINECKSVVVLDHHRQTSDSIENALLAYIEPYASSTCEMVAEILQYIQDGIKIKQIEADAMYGGIMIDTNNFSQKTGVRTFEAAAFLRRNGADVSKIRNMFRTSEIEFKTKAIAVSRAKIFDDIFVISDCPSEGVESPTVVCAQAANELLGIKDIQASFVVTEYNDKIYISARSIQDTKNVQLVMEKIGGGGHATVAGAQLEGYSVEEAKNLIIKQVKEMEAEGEI